ncbi:MAG: TolC family protein [Bacteroidales bacterium]|nr:TolC family protein [Bacteroidales bacterium]
MNKLSILFLFVSISAYSQQTITLNEMISMTLEKNYQIQIYRIENQILDNQNTAGNAGMLPTISADGTASMDVKNSELNFFSGDSRSGKNAQSTTLSGAVRLDYTVFDGFAMFANKDRLNYLAQIGAQETKYLVEQTIADISRLYSQLIMSHDIVELHQQSLDISRFRYRIALKQKEIGSINALELYQAEMDFNSDSIALLNAKWAVEDLQIQINRMLRNDSITKWTPVKESMELQGIGNEEAIQKDAIANNNYLQRRQMEELLAEANLRIEESARYPQVNLFGSYGYSKQMNEVGFTESSLTYGPGFGVTVRMNLYDGGKVNNRIENSQLETEIATLSRIDYENLIKTELHRLLSIYHNLLLNKNLLEKNLQWATKTIEIAEEQYNAGTISGFDFRQNQLSVIQINMQLINLMNQLRQTEMDVRRITGKMVE